MSDDFRKVHRVMRIRNRVCTRCGDPVDPDLTYKMCPECRRKGRIQNRKQTGLGPKNPDEYCHGRKRMGLEQKLRAAVKRKSKILALNEENIEELRKLLNDAKRNKADTAEPAGGPPDAPPAEGQTARELLRGRKRRR